MLGWQLHIRIIMVPYAQQQKTALHCASFMGHTTTVQLLLEKKADINARDDVSRK